MAVNTENVEAVCVELCAAQMPGTDWADANPILKYRVKEQVLDILNAAVRAGWAPPAEPAPGGMFRG